MRHVGSIVLSLVLTPLVYVLYGIGGTKWFAGIRPGSSKDYFALAVGLAALLAAGIAYALLTLLRLSPLGPVLAGFALVGVSLWAALDRNSFTATMPRDIAGVQGAGWVAGPVTFLLAIPLIATIVSPRRWRRYANAPATVAGVGTPVQSGYGDPYSAQPSSAPPSYSSSGYGPPSYPSSNDPNAYDPEATRRL
jgi:hypothetical protein